MLVPETYTPPCQAPTGAGKKEIVGCLLRRRGARADRFRNALRSSLLRQAEVEDFRLPARGDENVRGLDVAVDNPARVGRIQRIRNLDAGFSSASSAMGRPPIRARSVALQGAHHQKRLAAVFAHVVDGSDARVIQRRSGAGFALKSFERRRIPHSSGERDFRATARPRRVSSAGIPGPCHRSPRVRGCGDEKWSRRSLMSAPGSGTFDRNNSCRACRRLKTKMVSLRRPQLTDPIGIEACRMKLSLQFGCVAGGTQLAKFRAGLQSLGRVFLVGRQPGASSAVEPVDPYASISFFASSAVHPCSAIRYATMSMPCGRRHAAMDKDLLPGFLPSNMRTRQRVCPTTDNTTRATRRPASPASSPARARFA